MHFSRRRPWDFVPSSEVASESVWLDRRSLIKAAAASGALLLAGPLGQALADDEKKGPYPSKRNEKYKLDRELTDEKLAGTYNNFYEFSSKKDQVAKLTDKFK